MNSKFDIHITSDGSATLYRADIDEHYHSVKGAVAESRHVYRDCAFNHRLLAPHGSPLRVLEVGLGIGLNAVLTAMEQCECVHYIAFELHPLACDVIGRLGYDSIVDGILLRAIHDAPWNEPVALSPRFIIEKLHADFIDAPIPDNIDVVYFDAFAPEKQPAMWTHDVLARVVDAMLPGAVLTTYCAKGRVRRMLDSLGLRTERLAGPPGGKREILRAVKPW